MARDEDAEYRLLQRKAYEAIAEAGKRLNPNYLLHPKNSEQRQQAIDQAQSFLRELSAAARRVSDSGKLRRQSKGDKATEAENRSGLDVLSRLACRETLTQVAVDLRKSGDGCVRVDYEATVRSLSRTVGRLSKRAVDTLRRAYPHLKRNSSLQCVDDLMIKHAFTKSAGWRGFEFPGDLPAIREAIRRGLDEHD